MADKRKPGYCTYCATRVWVLRRNHFFTKWHCAVCGSRVDAVGPDAVRYMEARQEQQAAQARALANPRATTAGMPVNRIPLDDASGAVHTGLINRAFGWMIRD